MVYLTLLIFGFALTLIRWANVFNNSFVVINPEITSHISNFSLSFLVYLGLGSEWLISGMKFRFVTILGAFMIVANFICETLIYFLNTVDIIDALYGTVGILLVFVYLYYLNKNGLIKTDIDNNFPLNT